MNPKSTFFNLALAGIVILVTLGAWRPIEAQAIPPTPAATSCNTNRSVQVSGAAVVNVVPDRAMIELGVASDGATPDGVQNDNSAQIQRVTAAVQALGVDAKDIATDDILVIPVYEDYATLSIKGYHAENTVSITLRDVKLASSVIVSALKSGANEVLDVSFYTSELRKYRDQARELAITAAGEKARALATAAGAQAGCVISISESSSYQYFGSWHGGRQNAMWAQNTVQNAMPSQGSPTAGGDSPVNLGQIAIRAEVNASYALE